MDIEFYSPRKLKFKAWNTETHLLMRLHTIDCLRGELVKKDHVLLQFTGLHDAQQEEIYDMDVLLLDSEKYVVHWGQQINGWQLTRLKDSSKLKLDEDFSRKMIRLCSYFETNQKS